MASTVFTRSVNRTQVQIIGRTLQKIQPKGHTLLTLYGTDKPAIVISANVDRSMKRKYLLSVVSLFVATLLSACSSNNDAIAGDGSVTFSVIASGFNLNSDTTDTKKTEIFRDQASLALTASEYNIDISSADIDFDTSQVLLISAGVQPTGGYSIAVTDAKDSGDTVKLSVLLESPGANCILTQVLTHPFQLIEIESLKEIAIEERNVTNECEL